MQSKISTQHMGMFFQSGNLTQQIFFFALGKKFKPILRLQFFEIYIFTVHMYLPINVYTYMLLIFQSKKIFAVLGTKFFKLMQTHL
jgi:hypothetical protein